MIKMTHLSKKYGADEVFSGLDLEIKPGDFLYLLGKSGEGKSSLLRLLAGDDQDYQGELITDPKNIAYLEQGSMLDPYLTLQENCFYFLDYGGLSQPERFFEELLALLELDAVAQAFPAELSGGQLRRANLALVLCLKRDILLLDEPCAGLEPRLSEKLLGYFEQLNQAGQTIVLVTHDWEQCDKHPHPSRVLQGGRLLQP